jgi:hypothetical protein
MHESGRECTQLPCKIRKKVWVVTLLDRSLSQIEQLYSWIITRLKIEMAYRTQLSTVFYG